MKKKRQAAQKYNKRSLNKNKKVALNKNLRRKPGKESLK